jgi:hypothetical protein
MKSFLSRMPLSLICSITWGLLVAGPAQGAELTVTSGPQQTHLLELFSSEGCSSCPPAEEWFSALRQNPRLWKEIVPVGFHVDYWDGLGWPDPLAKPGFTGRQRNYAASWGSDTVYTPGFVLDGREWRARDLASIPESSNDAGTLTAVIREGRQVEITYQPPKGATGHWQAHAALLGMNIASDVKAGENSGRHLVHDFAVLSLQDAAMPGETPRATLVLPANRMPGRQTAVAVWVTQEGAQAPLQAAGGFL